MGVCDCREWHRMLVARQVSEAVQQLLDEPVVISKDQPLMTAGVSPTLAIQLISRLESIFSLELPGGAKTVPPLHHGQSCQGWLSATSGNSKDRADQQVLVD